MAGGPTKIRARRDSGEGLPVPPSADARATATSIAERRGSVVELQRRDEDVARHLDAPDRLHLLLAFLLLLQQLALTRDVAAVALGEHVLALGLHGLAGDDLATDRGLDRHIEHLPRDQFLQLLAHARPVGEC